MQAAIKAAVPFKSKQPKQSVEDIMKKVQQHCLLVTLNIHCWQGRPQIDEASVSINDDELDDETATQPHWKLMPKQWRAKFQNLEGKARGLIKQYSVPFKLRGVYIVPIVDADELFGGLREVRDGYENVTSQFVDCYDEWVDALRAKYGEDKFNMAVKHIPSKKYLPHKFGIEWAIVPMGRPGDTIDDFAVSDLVREAKTTMNKMIIDSVETMIRQPREELAEAVASLTKMLSADGNGRVKTASLEKVQRSFNKYRNFAQMIGEDSAALQIMRQVDAQLDGLSPQTLNRDEQIRDDLLGVLSSLKNEIADEAKTIATFDKFKRNLEI